MNILFIGDIVGRPGRNAVKQVLPKLKDKYQLDFVVANGENLAGGLGMTHNTYKDMINIGIDYFTSGNHIWKKADFIPNLDDKSTKVLRPANYPDLVPGRGYELIKIDEKKILLVNLMGLAFIDEYLNNPFIVIDEILKKYKVKANTSIIVDFHAETTGEKNCLGQYLDGKVSAVIGTHTHIATNDARVLPKGTAYITDAGMVGVQESSLGCDHRLIIEHFKTGLPFKLEIAEGPVVVNAVLIEINDKTGLAKNIEIIQEFVK